MRELGFGFPSESGIPVGVVLPFFGVESDVPSGWLLCDGRKFSVGQYAKLAAQLSRAAGAYTDTTPDLRGRVPVGLDNMGGTSANRVVGAWADISGGTSGAETHTLITAELPAHSHTQQTGKQAAAGLENMVYATVSGGATPYTETNGLGTSVAISTASINTTNTGSDSGHNNMQPSIAMNYIIKAA